VTAEGLPTRSFYIDFTYKNLVVKIESLGLIMSSEAVHSSHVQRSRHKADSAVTHKLVQHKAQEKDSVVTHYRTAVVKQQADTKIFPSGY
jgi:hypothetical protein